MPLPSVVVFDLGKVLVDFDYRISAEKIARRSRFTPDQVRDLLDHSPLLQRFETGLMSREQFYGEVCAACGFSGKLDEFCAAFADIFSEGAADAALAASIFHDSVQSIRELKQYLAKRNIEVRFPC